MVNKIKKTGILVGVLATVILGVLVILKVISVGEKEKFWLEDDLYSGGITQSILAEDFKGLIDEKKSFLVTIHMAYCPANMPLTDTTKMFAQEKGIKIYMINADEFKKTDLTQKIKYLPSMAIFKDGELIDFLDAESNEDLPYYQTVEGLAGWAGKYVYLQKKS